MAYLLEEIKNELKDLEEKGLLRTLPRIEEKEGPWVVIEGRRLLNLSSNDYLGLTSRLKSQELYEILRESTGAGAARLLSGNHHLYGQVEEELEGLYGRPALIFPSGYMANLGVISALCGRKDVVFADKLVHASLIDGVRLAGATLIRYPHLDYQALEELLKKRRPQYRRALIVSESVFSMDGDQADLSALIELKRRYEALLFLDEAHAVGVFGEKGLGVAEETGKLSEVDILLGTCGKALGSYGAFVIAEDLLKQYLINKARPFIFTTALPPVVLAATRLSLALLPKLKEEREKLRALSVWLRSELALPSGESPIVPVIVGSNEKALKLSQTLRERGYFVPAIRPPTVPPGTARLRLSLTAQMERHFFEPLITVVREFLALN